MLSLPFSVLFSFFVVFNEARVFNGDVSNWVLEGCFELECISKMFMCGSQVCEEFKGTLCGGAWFLAEYSQNPIPTKSYAEIGCCPVGSFMSNPEVSPFLVASSCSVCPVGRFTDDVLNTKYGLNGGVDDTSCKYCPKGYEADGTTKGCQVCSFSKVWL